MLFLLTMLLVINLNNFTLPTGSMPGGTTGSTRDANRADGLLIVTVESNLTVLSEDRLPGLVIPPNPSLLDFPLCGVAVSITNLVGRPVPIRNFTNSTGELAVYLPPSEYRISFLDWRLNYSAVSLAVFAGQVTRLEFNLNTTSFPVQSFSIADPYSSGWLVGWQQMFMLIPGTQLLSGATSNISSLYFWH